MTSRDGIEEQVKLILRDKASVEVSSADEDLIDTGVLDSLTFVELFLELEQGFGLTIDITTLELDDLRSVAKIVDFVARRQDG